MYAQCRMKQATMREVITETGIYFQPTDRTIPKVQKYLTLTVRNAPLRKELK